MMVFSVGFCLGWGNNLQIKPPLHSKHKEKVSKHFHARLGAHKINVQICYIIKQSIIKLIREQETFFIQGIEIIGSCSCYGYNQNMNNKKCVYSLILL